MASINIADDHPIMLSGLEQVLTAAGHQIAARAGTGEAALAAEAGDLFLLDLRMPGGSGLDVLRALRQRGDSRPVILISSAIDTASLREALALGAAGLVLKGCTPAQLLLCLDSVLAGQRWIDPGLLDAAVAADSKPTLGRLDRLNPRELSIVRLVVEGMRNRDIGLRMGMTEGNVKVTLHRVYERLGVSNRVEMAMLARDLLEIRPVAA